MRIHGRTHIAENENEKKNYIRTGLISFQMKVIQIKYIPAVAVQPELATDASGKV
jgi:hypothetical protein